MAQPREPVEIHVPTVTGLCLRRLGIRARRALPGPSEDDRLGENLQKVEVQSA